MVEKIILDYLTQYGPLPTYMERPEDAPIEYCLIEKTGENIADQLTTATIAVQTYGKSLYRAADFNSEVVDLMRELPHYSDAVSAVKVNTNGNFTDIPAKKHRYQAVFLVTYYN